jgi:flavin reductase (DIM6/NTAB) family NADH-FMN oxidoreductase RutF
VTAAVDAQTFKRALSRFASGITVVGAMVDRMPLGFTCQAFYSVSLNPPLVSFSVMSTGTRWPRIRAVGNFSINVLSADQSSLSDMFGRGSPANWEGVDWTVSEFGNPVISDVILHLDCTLAAEYVAGDHQVIIARVESFRSLDRSPHSNPLVYYGGSYHSLSFRQ